MRQEMMPDILPRLFDFTVEIHSVMYKKIPQKLEKLTEDFGDIFWRNIYAIIPHREVMVWCQDDFAKMNILHVYKKYWGMQIIFAYFFASPYP